MCEPVSGTLGVLSAVSGAASAVGQYQSASAAADAKNRDIANKANQRNRQYDKIYQSSVAPIPFQKGFFLKKD